MSLLIDTGVLYAFLDRSDRFADRAVEIVSDVRAGKHGRAFTTPGVVMELLTLLRRRSGTPRDVETVLGLVGLEPDAGLPQLVELTACEALDLAASARIQTRYWDRGLSLADANLVHTMERLNIDRLATFDSDFDGLVPTVGR